MGIGKALIVVVTCWFCVTLPAAGVIASAHPRLLPSNSHERRPAPAQGERAALTSVHLGSERWLSGVPILMYHDIRPYPGPSDPVGQDLTVSPSDFAREMAYLNQHGYHPVTLRELAEARADGARLPRKPVVLTFDDGYRNYYTNAWPVLRRYRFPSTIFVITGFVGHKWFMDWSQIRTLDRSGLVEVGSHTVTHEDLPSLSTPAADYQISQSKRVLEASLGHRVWSFCYPGGRYDTQDAYMVHSSGYRIAVTTQYGVATPGENPMELPRIRVHDRTPLSGFGRLLAG